MAQRGTEVLGLYLAICLVLHLLASLSFEADGDGSMAALIFLQET